MIRKFELQDLERIMELWLEGNMDAHPFIAPSYWNGNFEAVKAMIPQAEVYVYVDGQEILGFMGLDGDYIAGIFVDSKHRGHGIGRKLLEFGKKKQRLTLHVYEKNRKAVAFYQREGFRIRETLTDPGTGEPEHQMIYEEV